MIAVSAPGVVAARAGIGGGDVGTDGDFLGADLRFVMAGVFVGGFRSAAVGNALPTVFGLLSLFDLFLA